MAKDTVTLKTDTLAELMGMALFAANTGLLPANTYEEWFKLRFRREIEFTIDGLKNGWGREDIGALNNLTDSWVQRFKARKTFEKNLKACFDEKEKAEVKTTIGELVGYFDGYYLVDKGEEGTWLTKEEYEAVRLPNLDPLEVRRYKKLMRKGDKAEALTKLMYYVVGFKDDPEVLPYGTIEEHHYRLAEAIIKGGYNY